MRKMPLQIVRFTTRKDQNIPRQSLLPLYILVKAQGHGCENDEICFLAIIWHMCD